MFTDLPYFIFPLRYQDLSCIWKYASVQVVLYSGSTIYNLFLTIEMTIQHGNEALNESESSHELVSSEDGTTDRDTKDGALTEDSQREIKLG